MAALFADGRTPFDAVFDSFSIIGTVTFLILVGAAIPASWLHLPGRTVVESGADPACSSRSREAGALVQTNVARDGGRVFAAQGGGVSDSVTRAGSPTLLDFRAGVLMATSWGSCRRLAPARWSLASQGHCPWRAASKLVESGFGYGVIGADLHVFA